MNEQKNKGFHRSGAEDLVDARAKDAGTDYQWHYGRITRLGIFAVAGREVTVVWDEGGTSCHQGEITDDQWEILKLAFSTTGRIAVLSEESDMNWMYDYHFLEAMR